MDSRFEKVIAVKRRSHRSWANLYAAACKELGTAYSFGSENVENSSLSYLRTAAEESGLSIQEIKTELENRHLI